jgi:hypothetical protein
LCTITTTDPTDLQDLLKCICDLYIGVDGRQVTVEYGLSGIHVSVEEPVEYVDIAERIAPHIPQVTPVRLTLESEPTTWPEYPPVVLADLVDDTQTPDVAAERVAAALAEAAVMPEDPPDEVIDLTTPAKPAPAADPDGEVECSGCDDRFRTRRALSDHIRAAHWDDVIASYASTGARGVMDDWGVSSSTAYNWAAQINGAAA